MDRLDINSMYSTSHKLTQSGGGSKSSKSPKKKTNNYKPLDIDGESATALDKFRRANRLLQKELDEVKDALRKEKQKSSKLERQLKASSL